MSRRRHRAHTEISRGVRRSPAERAVAAARMLKEDLQLELQHTRLRRALTHRSYAYEHKGAEHNERLEFLGDAVLGLVITSAVYTRFPQLSEGNLAKLRSSVVSSRTLARVARNLGPDGLGAYLLLGKGEEATGGRQKSSILADTTEALLGAVFEEHGQAEAERVIHQLFGPIIAESAQTGAGLDWKTSLQELTAEHNMGVPQYHVEHTGPDHAKRFTAYVSLGDEAFAHAVGSNKKEAEQIAAQHAFHAVQKALDTP